MGASVIYETPKEIEIEQSEANYSIGQKWGALRKSWRGYRIALRTNDAEKAKLYAQRINKLQKSLGINVTQFKILSVDGKLKSD